MFVYGFSRLFFSLLHIEVCNCKRTGRDEAGGVHDGVAGAAGGAPVVDAAEAAVVASLSVDRHAAIDGGSNDGHGDLSASGASAHPTALSKKRCV